MLDFGHISNDNRRNMQMFGPTDGVGWLTYNVPRGKSFLQIMLWCAGGGGGGGASGAASTARGGGGGGGYSGFVGCIIPTLFLPTVLFVQAGVGGLGGGAGLAGASGGQSYVSVAPSSAQANLILTAPTPNGGGGGTSGAAGAGATTNAALSITAMPFVMFGIAFHDTAPSGSAGGAQTGQAGVAANPLTLHTPAGPGAGGGGVTTTDFVGGNNNSVSGLCNGASGGAVAGGRGQDGATYYFPTFGAGGAGGGTNNSGTGGAGGNGGLGSGGGGGGGGVTGGAGGNGGPGLVMIGAF